MLSILPRASFTDKHRGMYESVLQGHESHVLLLSPYYCPRGNKGRRRKGAQVEKPSRHAKRASTMWDFQIARGIHSTAFFHLALRAKESRGGQRCAFRRRRNKGFVVASSLVLLPLTPLVLLIPLPRLAAQRLPRSKECSQNKLKGHAKSRLSF